MPQYKVPKLTPPENTDLRFFAYGVFKPNQVAYSRIKRYVDIENIKETSTEYDLRERNGLPVLTENKMQSRKTRGYLIKFKPRSSELAYRIISNTKSSILYEWKVLEIDGEPANVLVGAEPEKTNIFMRDDKNYDGLNDPIFYDAINFIERQLQQDFQNETEWYFNLQMCYMLLWASIERFTTFKYGNNTKRYNNKKFSTEPAFKNAIRGIEYRYTVLNSENLNEYDFDSEDAEECIKYYYAIRCNVIHSGKSHLQERGFLEEATRDLLQIYKYVLDDVFVIDDLIE